MKTIQNEFDPSTSAFSRLRPWWHLYTPGPGTPAMLLNDEDYRFAMNLLARCSVQFPNVKIVAFALMSNHIHLVISGKIELIENYFNSFRIRLTRYLCGQGRDKCPDSFAPQLKFIESVQELRLTVAYVNRNGYVIDRNCTPYTYPWSTASYYFSNYAVDCQFGALNYNEKRQFFKSRVPEIPDHYLVHDGYIIPPSYCDIELGKSMYLNAWQYNSIINRNIETFANIADAINDGAYLSDGEVYTIIVKLIKDKYSLSNLRELNQSQLYELAKTLHFQYRTSNKQIQRLLNIKQEIIDAMFPFSK